MTRPPCPHTSIRDMIGANLESGHGGAPICSICDAAEIRSTAAAAPLELKARNTTALAAAVKAGRLEADVADLIARTASPEHLLTILEDYLDEQAPDRAQTFPLAPTSAGKFDPIALFNERNTP